MTKRRVFGNIVKRLAGDRERVARLNLENDTEQKRNAKRQMIPMSEDLQREQRI